MSHMPFLEESGSFAVNRPENVSYLYFPLASDTGMKSAVTPGLGGDAKLDQMCIRDRDSREITAAKAAKPPTSQSIETGIQFP